MGFFFFLVVELGGDGDDLGFSKWFESFQGASGIYLDLGFDHNIVAYFS